MLHLLIAEKDSGASNIDFYGLEDRSNPASPTSSIATSYEGASVISGSASSTGYRESRDERKVRRYGLPLSCSEIIDSSMEEFNDLLTRHTMTEEQISLCRDIRRRGKNKVIFNQYDILFHSQAFHIGYRSFYPPPRHLVSWENIVR